MRGRSESTGSGVSVPIEPSASTALRAIGAMIEAQILLRVAEHALLLHRRAVLRHERELRRQVVEVHETRRRATRWYGCCAASSALISSSGMIRPCVVSTRNMRPGSSRPFFTMCSGGDVEHADLATP